VCWLDAHSWWRNGMGKARTDVTLDAALLVEARTSS
jgi:hypothetical protein